MLSPLLFRGHLSLLFSLPNVHYSPSHSSLACLCPPPLGTVVSQSLALRGCLPYILSPELQWLYPGHVRPSTHHPPATASVSFPLHKAESFMNTDLTSTQCLLCPGSSEPNRNRGRSVPCGLGLQSPSLTLFCVSEDTALPQ